MLGQAIFLLGRFLDYLIRTGTLTVVDASGKAPAFKGEDGPGVTVRLHEKSLEKRLFLTPSMAAGEAYMNGTLTVEDASIYDLLELFGMNLESAPVYPLHRAVLWGQRLLRPLRQFNPVGRARAHTAHHYDLTRELFEMFLDSDCQYSCAYFTGPDDDLETAQRK